MMPLPKAALCLFIAFALIGALEVFVTPSPSIAGLLAMVQAVVGLTGAWRALRWLEQFGTRERVSDAR